jgi:hypothetical protein
MFKVQNKSYLSGSSILLDFHIQGTSSIQQSSVLYSTIYIKVPVYGI